MRATLALIALACGAVQFALCLAVRPDLRRLATIKSDPDPSDAAPRRRLDFERVGSAVLRVAGRRRSNSRASASSVGARSVGAAVVFGGGLVLVSPILSMLGAAAGWAWPRVIEARAHRARAAALAGDLPEVVDLLTLALGAGLNVPLAVDAVGRRGTGPLAAEMALAAEATRRGQRLADALDELITRCGEPVRPLMSLLASGERYGVPLGESLDRLAVDVRAARRRQAEEVARRLPVKMLFPLVVCILPAFALLTLGPLLMTSLRDLGW